MERFFQIRDRWSNGASLWVVAIVVFTLPLLGIWLKDLRLENDVTTWLPDDDPDSVVLDWFNNEFEKEDRLLVSWDSSSIHDPRVERFVDQLSADGHLPATLSGSTTPRDAVEVMLDNTLDEETAVDRLTGILIGNGFLKVQLTDAAKLVKKEAEQRVQNAASEFLGQTVTVLDPVQYREPQPVDPEADSNNEDDADEREPLHLSIPDHDFQLRWEGMVANSDRAQGLIALLNDLPGDQSGLVDQAFFAPGAPVAVSVAITEYGEEAHEETMRVIKDAVVAVGVPEEEFRIGGTTVARHRLSEAGNEAVWNRAYPVWNFYKRSPILLSAIVGVFTSFIMLRSKLLAVKVLATAIYACLVVMALIPATGKPLNIVLIVLPNLLLVLTMSGAIHVANYWKHAVADGHHRPVAKAIKLAWQPCMLASVTTSIGMASLMTAVLNPVQEFGVYSSVGCLISLIVILFLFPSLLTFRKKLTGRAFQSTYKDQARWEGVGGWLVRHRLPVNFACLALFVFSVYGLRWFETETRVIRYFLPHTRIVQDYNFLEESLAGIVSIETIVHFDAEAQDEMNVLERMELVRKLEGQIAEHPWISGTMSLADFRPVKEKPDDDAGAREKIFYGRAAQRMEREVFRDPEDNVKQFAKLSTGTLTARTANDVIEINEGDEVWRIRAQAAVLGDVDYGVLTKDLRQIVANELNGTPASSDEPETAGVTGTKFFITGMVPLFLKTQQAVLQSLIDSFALAFGVIAVVMMVLLRNPLSGILAMMPNLFPVGVVFGLVSWGRIPVDIGTMITASVALGIAIDGTLHLLKWFQVGIREGLTEGEAVQKALGHCGPAMWQTSLAIALGMLMLAGADLLLIHRFGWLMASLILVALVADVILLPSLLAGWLGRLIAYNTRKSMKQEEEAEEAESVSIEIQTARTA